MSCGRFVTPRWFYSYVCTLNDFIHTEIKYIVSTKFIVWVLIEAIILLKKSKYIHLYEFIKSIAKNFMCAVEEGHVYEHFSPFSLRTLETTPWMGPWMIMWSWKGQFPYSTDFLSGSNVLFLVAQRLVKGQMSFLSSSMLPEWVNYSFFLYFYTQLIVTFNPWTPIYYFTVVVKSLFIKALKIQYIERSIVTVEAR